jgi:hypothetical protein
MILLARYDFPPCHLRGDLSFFGAICVATVKIHLPSKNLCPELTPAVPARHVVRPAKPIAFAAILQVFAQRIADIGRVDLFRRDGNRPLEVVLAAVVARPEKGLEEFGGSFGHCSLSTRYDISSTPLFSSFRMAPLTSHSANPAQTSNQPASSSHSETR